MKNYCKHKDAGEFHCCGSQQYSLWQQGIAQTYCDVHHWYAECERLTPKAVDQIVTINLLTNQVAALRKELDAGKKPAALAVDNGTPHKRTSTPD